MANTYTLIASNTLTGTAASVTFSAIPATYDDLILHTSMRGTNASFTITANVTINGSSATNYSFTAVRGIGSTASSNRASSDTSIGIISDAASATSNTFSTDEMYIPAYRISQNKPISIFDIAETNDTTNNFIRGAAGLWRDTSAITSITFTPSAGSFASDSSFYLYGIKNT